jgi:hypothetical protein
MWFKRFLSECPGKNDSRPYWINLGLFYPGILGALIYEAGPRLYSWPWDSSRILIFVMLTHYALDYAYSVDEKNKREYSWCKFPFDFIIVWLLYAALKTATISPLDPSGVLQICWLLLATKVCALFWELLNNAHPDKCAKHLAMASDFVPLLGYGILISIFKNGSLVPEGLVNLLIVVVIVDAALYWVHEPMYRLVKDG